MEKKNGKSASSSMYLCFDIFELVKRVALASSIFHRATPPPDLLREVLQT